MKLIRIRALLLAAILAACCVSCNLDHFFLLLCLSRQILYCYTKLSEPD